MSIALDQKEALKGQQIRNGQDSLAFQSNIYEGIKRIVEISNMNLPMLSHHDTLQGELKKTLRAYKRSFRASRRPALWCFALFEHRLRLSGGLSRCLPD
jgi:hypothetical protein